MKKVIYVFLWFCLYLQGCEQKVEYQYDDVNRIYFQYEVLNLSLIHISEPTRPY